MSSAIIYFFKDTMTCPNIIIFLNDINYSIMTLKEFSSITHNCRCINNYYLQKSGKIIICDMLFIMIMSFAANILTNFVKD